MQVSTFIGKCSCSAICISNIQSNKLSAHAVAMQTFIFIYSSIEIADWRLYTVLTFNSCTKWVGIPVIIHDCTPDFHPVSWVWMHGWRHNWTKLWSASYLGNQCTWLIFWHVINVCLYTQALADGRSTGAGIKCLYCTIPPQWGTVLVGWWLEHYTLTTEGKMIMT